MPSASKPKIVVIGGGTGNSTLLRGLKKLAGEELTSIVSMVDDGGSTRILRDEYGTLPPGDLRQCLVALSNHPKEWREMFNYRFGEGRVNPEGGLKGHTLGNLIITAAEEFTATQQSREDGASTIEAAVHLVGELLNIAGEVLPVTIENRHMVLTTVDGQIIVGEHEAEMTEIPSLKGAAVSFNQSPTPIADKARQAVINSDVTVIAPGDLYTSIAPALAVDGMREALGQANKVVLVVNLMNRSRHTKGFSVQDYAAEIARIIGDDVLSYVVYNVQKPDERAFRRYTESGYEMVQLDDTAVTGYELVAGSFLSSTTTKIDPNDALAVSRSLVRHDSRKVAEIIMDIVQKPTGHR